MNSKLRPVVNGAQEYIPISVVNVTLESILYPASVAEIRSENKVKWVRAIDFKDQTIRVVEAFGADFDSLYSF